MESQEFLEDIRMAGAPGQEGFDQVNAGLIADHYGHSKEFILSLIRHERNAQRARGNA